MSPSRPYVFANLVDQNAELSWSDQIKRQMNSPAERSGWLLNEHNELWDSDSNSAAIPNFRISQLGSLDMVDTATMFIEIGIDEFPEPSFMKPVLRLASVHTLISQSLHSHMDENSPAKIVNHIPAYQLPYETLLCQMEGESHIRLFDPLQTNFLYPRKHRALFDMKFSRSPNVAPKLLTSQVDMSKMMDNFGDRRQGEPGKRDEFAGIDRDRFPQFVDNARLYRIHMRTNDCLFLPAFWWYTQFQRRNDKTDRNTQLLFNYEPHSATYELFWQALRKDNEPLSVYVK